MPELPPTQSNFIRLLKSALANRTASLPPDADTTAILRLATDHKLQHMILSAMPEELLPEPQNRRGTLIQHIAGQIAAAYAFLELWSDMEQAGFHPMVVKGIVCRSLYPQPELRPSSDEDLYVSDAEFEPCCVFLQDRGMTSDKTPFSDHGEIGWRNASGLYIELIEICLRGTSCANCGSFSPLRRLRRNPKPHHTANPSFR